MKLEACLDASTHKTGVPISISIRLVNDSSSETFVWNLIFQKVNTLIKVVDTTGREYIYPGANRKFMVSPPQSKEDFLLLRPHHTFGLQDVCQGELRIDKPGTYTLLVSYLDTGAGIIGRRLGLNAWQGRIDAKPIILHIT